MNFVSHYFCSQDSDPYHNLGLMMPDIFPRFSFYHNRFFIRFDTSLLTEHERHLWQGIAQHYRDDAYFHNMDSFKHVMSRIEEEMKKNEVLLSMKRKYLISHVLYELILDHMLMERYSDIVSEIYVKMDSIVRQDILQFLEKIMGKHSQIEVFLNSYDHFMARRFLNFYSLEHNLVKALHRVTGKISDWAYNEETEFALIPIIQQIKSEINLDQTFENIKSHQV